jgi:hypothetical protein
MKTSAGEAKKLPHIAQVTLRKFAPAVRNQVREILGEKEGIAWDDFNEALSQAFTNIAGDAGSMLSPDPRIVELSTMAYNAGNYLTTQDLLDDIARRMAAANQE